MSAPDLMLCDNKYIKYYCTMTTEATKPRLCLRHGDTTYYAALSTSADKPRLCLRIGDTTYYAGLIPKSLVSWVPFNDPDDLTYDVFGKKWTTFGNPTIAEDADARDGYSLKLDGSSYLQLDGGIKLGGQDFTIDGRVKMDSTASNNDRIFQLATSKGNQGTSGFISLNRSSATALILYLPSKSGTVSSLTLTNFFHFAIVHRYAAKSTEFYFNGVKKLTLANAIARTNWAFAYIGDTGSGQRIWNGSITDFRIFDGIAKWTADFTPPTDQDYVDDY